MLVTEYLKVLVHISFLYDLDDARREGGQGHGAAIQRPAPHACQPPHLLEGFGFRVYGLGFRVEGLGFGVWGFEFRV